MTERSHKHILKIFAGFLSLLLLCGVLLTAVYCAVDSSDFVIIDASDKIVAAGEKCNLLWGVTAVNSKGKSVIKDLTVTVNGSVTDIERTFAEGNYTVKYTVSYNGINYEKSVTYNVLPDKYIDITPPVLYGVRDLRVLTGSVVNLLEDVTAWDDSHGESLDLIAVYVNGANASNGYYTFSNEGNYNVVYTATDAYGNQSTANAIVTVSNEAYELARIENAIATTDRHDLTTATKASRETSILYSGDTGNGNLSNTEAVRITHSADTHAFTYFYMGETYDDYTDLTLGLGIEFYVYYSTGSGSVNVALSGGAERRSIRVNTANYQTSLGDGWYKVSMSFADFCSSESQIASTGEVNAVIFHMTCKSNSDYFIIDELTLVKSTPALAAPVVVATDDGISWNAVPNAAEYIVYNNGEILDTVTETSYSLSEHPAGFYSLSVVAVPANGDYLESRESNVVTYINSVSGQLVPLEAPVITRDFYTLKWEALSYATGYTLYCDGEPIQLLDAATESVDLTTLITDFDTHQIYIVANGDGTVFGDSSASNVLTYTYVSVDAEADDLAGKLAADYAIDTLDTYNFEHVSDNSLYSTVATGTITGTTRYSGLKYSFATVADFSEATISIDIKFVSNCDKITFKIKPTPDGASSSAYQVSCGISGTTGVTVTDLGNGFYRFVIDCGEAFEKKGGYYDVSSFMVGFSNVLDVSNSATVAFDNLHIDMPASIPAPVVGVEGNILSWDAVDGAIAYNIYYADGTLVESTTGTVYIFTPAADITGFYDLYIRSVNADNLEGPASDVFTAVYIKSGEDIPIETPNISLNGSILSWNVIDNAVKYQVLQSGMIIWEGTSTNCDLSKYVTTSAAVEITVCAIGDSDGGYGTSVSDAIAYCKAEAVDLTNSMVKGYNVNNIEIDTSLHSENSVQSIKLTTKTESGKAKYGNVLYYFPETTNLEGAIISFDYMRGNEALGNTLTLRVVASGTQIAFDMRNLAFSNVDSSLYTVEELSNGFIRVTVLGEAFSGIGMDTAADLDFGFSNSNSKSDSYATAGIIYLDNVTVEFPNSLSKSTLSINEGILTFTAVNEAVSYDIYVDDVHMGTIFESGQPIYSFDLNTLELASGDHTVKVIASAADESISPSTATITYNPSGADGSIDFTNISIIARDSNAVVVGSANVSSTGGYNDGPVIITTVTADDITAAYTANKTISRLGLKISLGADTFTGGDKIGVYVKASGYDLSKYQIRLQYKAGSYIYSDVTPVAVSDGWYYCEISIDSGVTTNCNEMYVFLSKKYDNGGGSSDLTNYVSLPLTLYVSGITIQPNQ